ncbi:MAG: type II toxin-antitoxin system MqsA family antitoxin [Verrucomicrobia bacterium]|nr:type II toxin-antitoxin system MqsA family antitoxin [Verrucomicrobiota bacterium]MDA1066826.1 type II toxin-antitoxin system MqsA family antitoxin [Verrucomicrobiota bacterium]
MKNKDIKFEPDDFLKAVEEVRDHVQGKRKITLRTTTINLPEPAPEITPEEIVAAREALNLSQPVFAQLLNVPTVTAISWEKGRRKPSGAALRLLQIVRTHPEVLLEAS